MTVTTIDFENDDTAYESVTSRTQGTMDQGAVLMRFDATINRGLEKRGSNLTLSRDPTADHSYVEIRPHSAKTLNGINSFTKDYTPGRKGTVDVTFDTEQGEQYVGKDNLGKYSVERHGGYNLPREQVPKTHLEIVEGAVGKLFSGWADELHDMAVDELEHNQKFNQKLRVTLNKAEELSSEHAITKASQPANTPQPGAERQQAIGQETTRTAATAR